MKGDPGIPRKKEKTWKTLKEIIVLQEQGEGMSYKIRMKEHILTGNKIISIYSTKGRWGFWFPLDCWNMIKKGVGDVIK